MEKISQQIGLLSIVKNYVSYNLWANETLVNWLKTKPEDNLVKEVKSSFPSIKKTLYHIWATERFWFNVIQSKELFPLQKEESISLDEVLEGLIDNSEQINFYINALGEDVLIADCHLDTEWVKGVKPRYEFIHHLCNHSTYHRGQVVTIGRNLGYTDAPMTDYNFFNFLDEMNW